MRGVSEKSRLHIPSNIEKQAENKTAFEKQSVMWQPQKFFHHTKRKTITFYK
jgi:hypothetical protein